eukprot:850757-Prorocentrum_minimum.AAC.1
MRIAPGGDVVDRRQPGPFVHQHRQVAGDPRNVAGVPRLQRVPALQALAAGGARGLRRVSRGGRGGLALRTTCRR